VAGRAGGDAANQKRTKNGRSKTIFSQSWRIPKRVRKATNAPHISILTPWCTDYLDALEIPEKKEKVVVLGSGWGALAVLQELNRLKYDVTVISPRNYFVFTPLVADAAVGAVDVEKFVKSPQIIFK
jgi:glutamyl-tRNA reductase